MSSPVPLFLEDEVPAQREKRFPSRQRGRVFDLTEAIERMIAAGYHEAVGKGPAAYRRLWPKQVEQPRVYAGRFDHALLVDRAVGLRDLVACGKIISYAPMEECRDLIAAPAVKGKPLVRYILFFRMGRNTWVVARKHADAVFGRMRPGWSYARACISRSSTKQSCATTPLTSRGRSGIGSTLRISIGSIFPSQGCVPT